MSGLSTTLERTSTWDEICFPVSTIALQEHLPADFDVLATDRLKLVVGQGANGRKSIYAIQSDEYTVIPNSLLRSVVESCLSDYSLDIAHSRLGEFSINIITPEETKVGDEYLQKSLILNNSYSGKSPFTVQGTVIETKKEKGAIISWYRQICSNGLMGWVDEFVSLDEYLQWLIEGQPKKKGDLKVKSEISERISVQSRNMTIHKKFSHRKLDLEWFEQYLHQAIMQFVSKQNSLTPQVYARLEKADLPKNPLEIITDSETIALPKMLARQAIERMKKEEIMLKTKSSLWLLYNGINHALFNSRSSLNIADRFTLDEKALHYLASLTL